MILKIQNRISVYEPDVGIKFVIKILQKFHMGELFIYSKRIALDAWSFQENCYPKNLRTVEKGVSSREKLRLFSWLILFSVKSVTVLLFLLLL